MFPSPEDIERLSPFFEAMPGSTALIQVNPPVFSILAVTDDFLSNSGSTKKQLVGKGIFENFPSNPDDTQDTGQQNLLASFEHVIKHKIPHQLAVQRYDVVDKDGIFTERYWVAKNKPVLNDAGDVAYIIHTAEEITDQIKAKRSEDIINSIKHADNMFKQAPFAISILKGKDFIIEFVNEKMIEIYGHGKQVLHNPLAAVMPELEAQGHIEILRNVLATEKLYQGYESPLSFEENGVEFIKYFNFVYKPYYEDNKPAPSGVMVFINEVTDKISIKTSLSESEERFRTMAEGTEVLIAVGDESSNATYFNKAWSDLTGRPMEALLNFGWLDLLHPEDRDPFLNKYLEAFKNRQPFTGEFRILNKMGEYCWLLVKSPVRFRSDGSFAGYISSCIDITYLKKTEGALIESVQKFQKLLESLPQMTWTNLPDGEINFYSSKWREYTGVSGESTKYGGWKDIIHPDDVDSTLNAFAEALKTGNTFAIENRFKRKDGVYRWHLNRALPIRNDKGEITSWIGTATDIDDRNGAENAALVSAQRLRSVVESAPFPIGVYIGREMRIELANQSIIGAWGKGMDVIGKLYSDILPELDNQDIFTQLENVFDTGIPFHAKNQRVDIEVNGKLQIFYFNYSFTPLFDSFGKVYGVMNTAADVTDLNLAKKQVEDSEQQLRSLVMSAPVGICIIKGPLLVVEVVNDSFLQVVGRSRESFAGMPYWEALPEAAPFYEPILNNVFTTGMLYRGNDEEVILTRNGKEEILYVNFVYDPIKDATGAISRVMIVVLEVTDQVIARRKIEEVIEERTKELAEANRNLKKSNDELAQFAYIASHDLQEPLRKVSTYSQMLEQSLPEISERSKGFLTKISVSTNRMTNLIRDVLTYSQLSKETEVYEWVNLEDVVNLIKNDFELLIEQKQATIHSYNLPTIQAIPLQMSQLVMNLVSNALKFSIAAVKPVITISARLMEEQEIIAQNLENNAVYYDIAFKDNGIGFNQEHASRIFSIFQRLHGKTEYSGTGIGLAMCKKIVLNHHGDIYATATKGSGATFNVMLPATQPVVNL